MLLQKAPNNWSCLPTAFAIASNLLVEGVIKYIGHDGSEIVAPDNPEPYCRRGFHIQEIIEICYSYGWSLTPFQPMPVARYRDGTTITITFNQPIEERMERIMSSSIGIITGSTLDNKLHAVAWNGKEILDPNGTKYGLNRFRIDTYWALQYATAFIG